MKREFKTLMANNSTNINKMNNLLSSQTIRHKKDHNVGNPGTGLGQEQKCGSVKPVIYIFCLTSSSINYLFLCTKQVLN
jgi:hypothetical protein